MRERLDKVLRLRLCGGSTIAPAAALANTVTGASPTSWSGFGFSYDSYLG